jgi:hypothetical protein
MGCRYRRRGVDGFIPVATATEEELLFAEAGVGGLELHSIPSYKRGIPQEEKWRQPSPSNPIHFTAAARNLLFLSRFVYISSSPSFCLFLFGSPDRSPIP